MGPSSFSLDLLDWPSLVSEHRDWSFTIKHVDTKTMIIRQKERKLQDFTCWDCSL